MGNLLSSCSMVPQFC
uniref:Uncharacterized protein n=1 Tax=Rhizophora mucronata TaxID=61149 RepID=A0A2P2PHC3_RHIMU